MKLFSADSRNVLDRRSSHECVCGCGCALAYTFLSIKFIGTCSTLAVQNTGSLGDMACHVLIQLNYIQ
jgi:hypothetical protein